MSTTPLRTFQDPAAAIRAQEAQDPLYAHAPQGSPAHHAARPALGARVYARREYQTATSIHAMYASGKTEEIVNGFYFNLRCGKFDIGDLITGQAQIAKHACYPRRSRRWEEPA